MPRPKGKYAPATINKDDLSPTQAAYLAGMIDGDGCIGLYRLKGGSIRRSVDIGNKSKDLMDWIRSTLGKKTGHISVHGSHDVFHWQVTRTLSVKAILETTMPYLVIKKDDASALLGFINNKLSFDEAKKIMAESKMRRRAGTTNAYEKLDLELNPD